MYGINGPINAPWQEEALHQRALEREKAGLPRCECCAEAVTTERYLDLEPFGLKGVACGRCVELAMEWTQ